MNPDVLAALAASTEDVVVALYERWVAGEITEDEFIALAVAALARGTSRAVALADVALAAAVTVATGTAVAALGLTIRPGEPARLRTVARALVAALPDEPDPVLTVRVASRAETLAAAQRGYGEGMRRRGVARWTRRLNGGACDLCRDLAGVELPGSAEMYAHKGCGCTQRPILTERSTAA